MNMSAVEEQTVRAGQGGGEPGQKTLIERVLSPIADVRREEAAGALVAPTGGRS